MNKLTALIMLAALLVGCVNQGQQSVNLNDFPQNWVQLTDEDGKYIISVPCEGNNPVLYFENKENKWWLTQFGPQDDFEFEVLTANRVNDTIVIHTKIKGSDDYCQDFKIVWLDNEKGIARWITSYSEDVINEDIFVIAEKQNQYPVVDNEGCNDDMVEIFEESITIAGQNFHAFIERGENLYNDCLTITTQEGETVFERCFEDVMLQIPERHEADIFPITFISGKHSIDVLLYPENDRWIIKSAYNNDDNDLVINDISLYLDDFDFEELLESFKGE